MHEKPESELIAQSRCGDMSAMTELFRRYYPSSVRVAQRILRSPEDSQDAVQTAYLCAYRHFNTFRQDASFKTWITRIVVNNCVTYFRRPERRQRWVWLDEVATDGHPFALSGHTPTPEAAASSRETAAAVARVILKLPPPMRDVVQLCTIAGLSTSDAANALGLSIPATKTRLFRARLKMQAQLQRFHLAQERASAAGVS